MQAIETTRIFKMTYSNEVKKGTFSSLGKRHAEIYFESDEHGDYHFSKCSFNTNKSSYDYCDWMFLKEIANEIERIEKNINPKKIEFDIYEANENLCKSAEKMKEDGTLKGYNE